MAPVYSKQLVLQESFQGGPLNVYTVPPNKVTVIKCMAITFGVNLTVGSAGFLETTTGARLFATGAGVSDIPTHDFTTAVEFGTWTLEFPQGISIETGGTPTQWICDFIASGYELTTP